MSTLLKTDAYEFTMLSSLVEAGKADDHAVFELFARKYPTGRRFGVAVGLLHLLRALEGWVLSPEDLAFLQERKLLTAAGAQWLSAYEGKPLFTGTLRAYREGEVYRPYSPLVQVEGKLGEALLLETLLLSIYNHDTAVASAAARMALAAQGKPMIEMGTRRTDDEAAVHAALAAYLAGFSSTSNVEAARRYGIPTAGTAAHAFTLSFASEEEAFAAQLKSWGVGTTLLVDTYDTTQGIKNAVAAAQALGARGPGAIRIDSGDMLLETAAARKLLDGLGATETRIVVSSDLDEYSISDLSASPVDGFGVGTRVATGSGKPTAGFVYKLVELEGKAKAKASQDKASVGGKKTPFLLGGEEYFLVGPGELPSGAEELYHTVLAGGEQVAFPSVEASRSYLKERVEALPPQAKLLGDGPAFGQASPWGVA